MRNDLLQAKSAKLAGKQLRLQRTEKLNSDNIGFRMLTKQGWTGGSIGKNEDGIAEPVS